MSLLLILLSSGYVLLFVALRFGFGRSVSSIRGGGSLPSLSVIVPAKNESRSILPCLNSIARCDYAGEFEIIVVDSNSTDDTADKIRTFCSAEDTADRFRFHPAGRDGDKLNALLEGIELSSGEIILTTDSDCIVGSDWIRQMASSFSESTGIVAGPVVYESEDRVLFDRLQKLEFAGLVGAGAATLGLGVPSICNSANLAYRRSVFQHFRHLFTDSKYAGADEAMLQLCELELGLEPRFCASRESIVYAKPVPSLGVFFKQRIRWASGPINFPSASLVLLALAIFALYAGILLGPLLVYLGYISLTALLWSFGLKAVGDAIFLTGPLEYFGQSALMKVFIPFELLHIPYVLLAASVGTIKSLLTSRNR